MEYSDVDGLLDAPGFFLVEDLYTLHGDLVAWPPIRVQGLMTPLMMYSLATDVPGPVS